MRFMKSQTVFVFPLALICFFIFSLFFLSTCVNNVLELSHSEILINFLGTKDFPGEILNIHKGLAFIIAIGQFAMMDSSTAWAGRGSVEET